MNKYFSRLLVVITLLCFSLVGCSSSAKPQSSVDTMFKAIKECNYEKLSKVLYTDGDEKKSDKDMYEDKTFEDIFKENGKLVQYKITDTQINGEEATIKVDCTYGDALEIFGTAFQSYVKKAMTAALASQKQTEEESKKMLDVEIKEAQKNIKLKTTTSNFEIKCKKVDGKWLVVSDENIANVMSANIVKGFSDLAKMGSK